jgi:U32 family peptidase
MAISGKCYLSLHSHNSSANRGACKQNCRHKYKVEDEEGNLLEIDNEYIMSAKDLQTISFLDKIMETGVSVLKIEGRGRSPEYVKEVTSCYKEAVASCYNKTYNSDKVQKWVSRLETVYNRGFWDGYYLGRKLGEWTNGSGSRASRIKTYIGKVTNFYERVKAGEFILESDNLSLGDEILITGAKTGVLQCKVESLRLGGNNVPIVNKGDIFSMLLPEKIRPSDKLFKLSERSDFQ